MIRKIEQSLSDSISLCIIAKYDVFSNVMVVYYKTLQLYFAR